MTAYELVFLVKKLSKPELVESVSKIGAHILNNKGILRKIEFMGFRTLNEKLIDPANPKDSTYRKTEANFFLFHFDASPALSVDLSDEFLKMNRDVLRYRLGRKENLVSDEYLCDLFEDLKPPVHRKSVAKMQEIGQKLRPKKFNTIRDPFYPMH